MNISVHTRDVRGESYNCKESITMEIVKSTNSHVWFAGEDCEDPSRGFFALWQGIN